MDAIILNGVRTHNLKNIDLVLPHNKLYVFTGVSGSGKSSLAFDTLYAEGQRRYVESLSSYARQFLERIEKPDAESITGIPPAIAIEAKNTVNNARSTVGTQTEINDYLRVLFARIGKIVCPDCQQEVAKMDPQRVSEVLLSRYEDKEIAITFPVSLAKKGNRYLEEFLPELDKQGFTSFYHGGKIKSSNELLESKVNETHLWVCVDRLKISKKNLKRSIDSLELAYRTGRGTVKVFVFHTQEELKFSENLQCYKCAKIFREPVPNLFSFNSPLGACPACQGFGRVITIDWNLVVPDESKSISEGAIEPWTKPSSEWEFRQLLKFCEKKKIPTAKPWRELRKEHQQLILFEGSKKDDYFSVKDFYDYLEKKTYKMHVRIFLSKYRKFIPCKDCGETRLKPEALCVLVAGKNFFDLQLMSLDKLQRFFDELVFSGFQKEKIEPVHFEIIRRLRFLNEVGLGYLSLARLSRTLSGGEVQRIHLATSLGSALVDTLYVLDEPSIGLHDRDNHLLIRLLKELRDLGNTVVVVEHDRTMIEAADETVDMGPMGGERGGQIIFQGPVDKLRGFDKSVTGQYLKGAKQVARVAHYEIAKNETWIKIRGASEHNLKNVDVDIPLKKFVVLTGVSGSGKSTLLYDILYHHFLREKGQPVQDLGKVRSVSGFENIDEVVLIDQSPIGRTPRSNPATYLKAYDDIRKIFASLPESKRMGYEAGHFSFNVDGGRCDVCKGDGRVKVEMHFLADVFLPCEACGGKRFKPEILEILCNGKSVDDVLNMTVDDAVQFFEGEKGLISKLAILQRVGLGYLRLGQSATTLSGGEAQRMKLAYEMSETRTKHTLYLFDEPTTGLHFHDIHFLMEALDELLKSGHSVVIIEHNMDVIRCADYVIDLGPEGGDRGGELVFAGPLMEIIKVNRSHTGKHLKMYIEKLASGQLVQV